jgi:hypothetical protein
MMKINLSPNILLVKQTTSANILTLRAHPFIQPENNAKCMNGACNAAHIPPSNAKC